MSVAETFGRTVQLFLVDGKPTGLRKVTIHGWTGVTLVSSQSTFAELLNRPECNRTGVYFLVGPDPERRDTLRVYIGAATTVKKRVKESAEEREFWETAIAITTSDDDLSKGHAEYLEARLIELTKAAARVTMENDQYPKASNKRLPEADAANMEQFLLNIRVVLPVVGLDILKPQPRAVRQDMVPPQERTEGEVQFELRHKSGVQATAVEEDGEFVVLEGSEALTDTGYVSLSYAGLKKDLIQSGVLVTDAVGKLRFSKPWSFKSPSAASAIILDRNSNGRTEWKLKNSKLTYNDWQEAQATILEPAE